MRPATDLGKFIRKSRCDNDLGSARSLSLKLGLSHSYLAALERGDARPPWKLATRLMRALQLTVEQRDEFTRLWKAAGMPPAARAVAAAVALPGLVLWHHLPELLYTCRSKIAPFPQGFLDDEVLFQGVRCAAAILSWVALVTDPPGRRQRDALNIECRRHAERTQASQRATAPKGEISASYPAWLEGISFLTHLWRRTLFQDQRAAARWVRLLEEWDCLQAGLASSSSTISFYFRDTDLQRRYGVFLTDTDIVCRCHDALVTMRLASELGLIEDENALAEWLDPGWGDLDFSAKRIENVTTDDFRRDLHARRDDSAELSIEHATRRASFALRLFDVPPLAARVFGAGDEATATRFRLKVAELEAVYDTEYVQPRT